MGRRSQFDRLPRDYYRTIDPRAVAALKPFITKGSTFVEPCAGDGILTDQLVENLGLRCVGEFDIEPDNDRIIQKDALTITKEDVKDADLIISNPPWDRKLLHPMIEHFAKLKPTWLLFDHEWSQTLQSKLLMKEYCVEIVAIGRLKWIEKTTMQSKDSCSWYKFDINKNSSIKFHGR